MTTRSADAGTTAMTRPADFLSDAVEVASAAPSVHNTQPWRFRLTRHGTGGGIELFADRSRALDVLDPTGRQLEISCGIVLYFLRVALRATGHDTTVALLPAGDGVRNHLASVLVRPGLPGTAAERARADAIGRRHSQRAAFSAEAVSPALLQELQRGVESEGGWLALLHRRDDQLGLITLLSRADRELSSNPEYIGELGRWLRTADAPDGIPLAALPDHVERHTEVALRDYNPARVGEAPVATGDTDPEPAAPVDEHPTLAVLGTSSDGAHDHLVAGIALGRLLLQATVLGIGTSLLGQVMDLPGPRAQLRAELDLVGAPQIVLRLGYVDPAAAPAVASGRRPLADMLRP